MTSSTILIAVKISDQSGGQLRNYSRYLLMVALLFMVVSGRFCVQGDSVDCWHWRNPRPSALQVDSVTYGGGIWVGLGEWGSGITSIDGTNWDYTTVGGNYTP